MKVEMFGGGLTKASPRKPKDKTVGSVTISRMWRLGDIVMCEPAVRLLSESGREVFFSTRHEYFPVVSSFKIPPKGVMSHGITEGETIDLDSVGLLHPGFDSKIDAFLATAGFDPANFSEENKCPSITVDSRHQQWAKSVITSKNIAENFVSIVYSAHDVKSPRSLSRKSFEEVCLGISKFYDVVVVGAKPTKLGFPEKRIHNLTGSTPDVMSLAGVFSMSAAVVSIDTGTMHLAGAAGVPLVSILGPTLPKDVCPYYNQMSCLFADPGECSPCFDRGCDTPCLERIDPETIVRETLARVSSPDHPRTIIVAGR